MMLALWTMGALIALTTGDGDMYHAILGCSSTWEQNGCRCTYASLSITRSDALDASLLHYELRWSGSAARTPTSIVIHTSPDRNNPISTDLRMYQPGSTVVAGTMVLNGSIGDGGFAAVEMGGSLLGGELATVVQPSMPRMGMLAAWVGCSFSDEFFGVAFLSPPIYGEDHWRLLLHGAGNLSQFLNSTQIAFTNSTGETESVFVESLSALDSGRIAQGIVQLDWDLMLTFRDLTPALVIETEVHSFGLVSDSWISNESLAAAVSIDESGNVGYIGLSNCDLSSDGMISLGFSDGSDIPLQVLYDMSVEDVIIGADLPLQQLVDLYTEGAYLNFASQSYELISPQTIVTTESQSILHMMFPTLYSDAAFRFLRHFSIAQSTTGSQSLGFVEFEHRYGQLHFSAVWSIPATTPPIAAIRLGSAIIATPVAGESFARGTVRYGNSSDAQLQLGLSTISGLFQSTSTVQFEAEDGSQILEGPIEFLPFATMSYIHVAKARAVALLLPLSSAPDQVGGVMSISPMADKMHFSLTLPIALTSFRMVLSTRSGNVFATFNASNSATLSGSFNATEDILTSAANHDFVVEIFRPVAVSSVPWMRGILDIKQVSLMAILEPPTSSSVDKAVGVVGGHLSKTGNLSIEFQASGLSASPVTATFIDSVGRSEQLSMINGPFVTRENSLHPDGYNIRGSVGVAHALPLVASGVLGYDSYGSINIQTTTSSIMGDLKWIRNPDRYIESTVSAGTTSGSFVSLVTPSGLTTNRIRGSFFGTVDLEMSPPAVDFTILLKRDQQHQCINRSIFFEAVGDAQTANLPISANTFYTTGRLTLNNGRVFGTDVVNSSTNSIDLVSAFLRGDIGLFVSERVDDLITSNYSGILRDSMTSLNDAPMFASYPNPAFMAETAPPGSPILRNNPNRPFVASLSPADQIQYQSLTDLFEFSPSTNFLTFRDTGIEFDYRIETSLEVRIRSFDPASTRSEVSTFKITLIDVNNQPPVFESRVYNIQVPEALPADTIVATLRAVDGDPTFPELSYTWVSGSSQVGNVSNLFSITSVIETDENTGDESYVGRISTRRPLLRSDGFDGTDTLTATVSVSDGVNEQDVTVVNFQVLDVNDNAPHIHPPANNDSCLGDQFDNSSCTSRRGATVREDAKSGRVIYTFIASDNDIGNNGEIEFHLTTAGPDCDASAGLFSISTTRRIDLHGGLIFEGTLSVSRRLDFEQKSEHRICVFAQDAGAPPLTSEVLEIVFPVEDVPFSIELTNSSLTLFDNGESFGTTSSELSLNVLGNGEDGASMVQYDIFLENETTNISISCLDTQVTNPMGCRIRMDMLQDGYYSLNIKGLPNSNTTEANLTIDFVVDSIPPVAYFVDVPGRCTTGDAGIEGCVGGGHPLAADTSSDFTVMTYNAMGCPESACRSSADLLDCVRCRDGTALSYWFRVDGFSWTPFEEYVTNVTEDIEAFTLSLGNLSEGEHVVEIKVKDALGNDAYVRNGTEVPLRYKWEIDTVPPRSMIWKWPFKRISPNTSAIFEVFSDDPEGTFLCELDGFAQPCDVHYLPELKYARYTNLSHGMHVFRVLAEDQAGNINVDKIPTYDWMVDIEGPTMYINSLPFGSKGFLLGGVVDENNYDIHFSASEAIIGTQCRFTTVDYSDYRGECCSHFETAGVLQECSSSCRIGIVDPRCTAATNNATLRARRAYSACAMDELKSLNITSQASDNWTPCYSPFSATDLKEFDVFLFEVVGTDLYGNSGSKFAPTSWRFTFDKLYLDRKGEQSIQILSRPIQVQQECQQISLALIVACIVSWALLIIVLGLLWYGVAYYEPPKLGEVKVLASSEDISYDEAMAAMGIAETSLDTIMHAEPGYTDTFGFNKFSESEEASTDPVMVPNLNPILAAKAVAAYSAVKKKPRKIHTHTLEISSDPVAAQEEVMPDETDSEEEATGFGDLNSSDDNASSDEDASRVI